MPHPVANFNEMVIHMLDTRSNDESDMHGEHGHGAISVPSTQARGAAAHAAYQLMVDIPRANLVTLAWAANTIIACVPNGLAASVEQAIDYVHNNLKADKKCRNPDLAMHLFCKNVIKTQEDPMLYENDKYKLPNFPKNSTTIYRSDHEAFTQFYCSQEAISYKDVTKTVFAAFSQLVGMRGVVIVVGGQVSMFYFAVCFTMPSISVTLCICLQFNHCNTPTPTFRCPSSDA